VCTSFAVNKQMIFSDREQAGRLLAEQLKKLSLPLKDPIVLALPRGGVPVALEIAQTLNVPLEPFIVRKIGSPENPEFAIGAVAEGGHYWINHATVESLGFHDEEIAWIVDSEKREVDRRATVYRGDRKLSSLENRDIILVDDGVATGSTVSVACRSLKKMGAKNIIVASPVCSRESISFLSGVADEIICLEKPTRFFAVGAWYEDFSEVTDEDVVHILQNFVQPARTSPTLGLSEEITVEENGVRISGRLSIPETCRGLILFAHGSGSSRFSPRNMMIAKALQQVGYATLLFDLLSADEETDQTYVFDIPLLAQRLELATRWVARHPQFKDHPKLPIGYFGASTGAAAAIWAAADLGNRIFAVVSRGGRPDLAVPKLREVIAPVLLLVGGDDDTVIELNEMALDDLTTGEMEVIPGATHLFEEPGKLAEVGRHAIRWFDSHLPKDARKVA
jgi:putative phosphoribosyl transferase